MIQKKYLAKFNTLSEGEKTLNKLEIEGSFPNLLKNIYEKFTVNIILCGEIILQTT